MKKSFEDFNILVFKHKLEEKGIFSKKKLIPDDKIKDISNKIDPQMYSVYSNDALVDEITEIIDFLYRDSESMLKKVFKDLLSDKTFYGMYLELMTYIWLKKNNVSFKHQLSAKTLSKHEVILDGLFEEGNVYFDIKSFGLGMNIEKIFKRHLEKKFPDYIFMIEGNLDTDYNDLGEVVLGQIYKHLENIEREFDKNIYKISKVGWEIRWYKKKKGCYISEQTFNPYKWANDNEDFFLKNIGQYTPHFPFILICTMPEEEPAFSSEIALRSIARRAFIHLSNKYGSDQLPDKVPDFNRLQEEYQNDFTKYLSGIIFLSLKRKEAFIYLNPNAENSISINTIYRIFNFEVPSMGSIDDFIYDNY